MLAGIYYGAQYGGSTTAILVNLPGETSSVVTCIDGYQMARQGRAGPALAIAAIGSFFAGTVCTLLIAMFGPPLAEMALKFGAAGVLLADADGPGRRGGARPWRHGQVARDGGRWACCSASWAPTSIPGVKRFTFGFTELTDGIGFVVVAVGVFAVGEIISNLGEPEERRSSPPR